MTNKSSYGSSIAHLGGDAHRAGRETSDRESLNFHKEIGKMKALVARFVREESGQDLIEYGLLVGIITSGAVLSIKAIAPIVSNYYTNLQANLEK